MSLADDAARGLRDAVTEHGEEWLSNAIGAAKVLAADRYGDTPGGELALDALGAIGRHTDFLAQLQRHGVERVLANLSLGLDEQARDAFLAVPARRGDGVAGLHESANKGLREHRDRILAWAGFRGMLKEIGKEALQLAIPLLLAVW